MIPWLPKLDPTDAVYRSIYHAIDAAIRSGALQAGDRLPTHRAMARALGVDLTTVTRGYAEAQRHGLLEAVVGRGTFVRALPLGSGDPERDKLVDMTMNMPPQPADPSLRRMIQESVVKLFRAQNPADLLSYRWGAGSAEERAAGAAWIRPTLEKIDPQHVLVCAGAQAAMMAVLSTLAVPGDTVLAERIAYPGIRALATQLGLSLVGVEMDEEGMLPDALDRACAELRPKLIYCNPTIQNPTTATMGDQRRRDIAAVARSHAVPVLEDDTYGLFPADRLPALGNHAPELVYTLVTTAKTISPSLRIAYLVVPGQAQARRITAALRATSLMPSGLLSALVTLWIKSGQARAVMDDIRAQASLRQAAVRALLGDTAACHPEGLHAWIALPPHWTSAEFSTYTRNRGLAVVPCGAFTVQGEAPNAVRVALGAAPSTELLVEALKMLPATLQRHVQPEFDQIV